MVTRGFGWSRPQWHYSQCPNYFGLFSVRADGSPIETRSLLGSDSAATRCPKAGPSVGRAPLPLALTAPTNDEVDL